MDRLAAIFWLGTKELRSLRRDTVICALLIYAFTFAIYTRAVGSSAEIHNASLAIVDEDHSALSRAIAAGFHPPHFQIPKEIAPTEIDDGMDAGRFMFVLDIPPDFEASLREGLQPELQLNIDATAMSQASIGAQYIQKIVSDEVERARYESPEVPPLLVRRMAFNPNRNSSWFNAIVEIIDNVTMLTIILTGAALIREREHGTIEHLLAMPLTAFEIASSKVWANALVILGAVTLSMTLVIRGLLDIPIAGSMSLFLAGTALYLFFATALGVFLGTVCRTMGQFSLLILLVLLPLQLLSGGVTPIESQPAWLQPLTFLLPSRHFVSFSQAIIFRGAGLGIVWPEFLTVTVLGGGFFVLSLLAFRRSIATVR